MQSFLHRVYLTDLCFFMQLVHRATAAMIGALAALSFLSYMSKVNCQFYCNYLLFLRYDDALKFFS